MNDLKQRVENALVVTGTRGYTAELLSEVWAKLTYQEQTVEKMIGVLIDRHTALLKEVKALKYDNDLLRQGMENHAVETAGTFYKWLTRKKK